VAEAFECSVKELPLTPVISRFEQEAVAVLPTLLGLGVKGITPGPNAPAFVAECLCDPAGAVRPTPERKRDAEGDMRLAMTA
jgi:hydroxylamine reductase